jgi:hypothetical protein
MKKLLCISLFFLSLCSFAQASKNDVVKGRLFSVDERVRIQLKYDERLPELQLSDDQLYRYSTIIDDNFYYMIDYNKKGNRTKEEVQKEIKKRVGNQNKDLKKLLSSEQYTKHLEIYQTVIMTPIQNRLDSY